MKAIGIILIVLGVIGLAWGGISWTNEKKVVDIGSLEITSKEHERIPLPPVAGAVLLVVGAGLLVAGSRRRG